MINARGLFNRIPAAWRIPALALAGLVLLALLWFYGTKAWNGVGNFMYHHSENDAKKEISGIKSEVAQEKQLADKAVAAYEASKQAYEEEKKQHDIAKQILADKSKNTDQKLATYEAAVNARPTVTAPESTNELCLRAKALGFAVTCQ